MEQQELDEMLRPILDEILGPVGEKIEFKPDPIPGRKQANEKGLKIIKSETPIDREKLESVLREIDNNYVLQDNWVNEDGHSGNKISGKIGANVTFDGVWNSINKFVGDYTDNAEIDLQAKGKKLSKLNVEYDFGTSRLRPHVDELFILNKQKFAPLDNITEIAVTSPAWEKSNGLVTQSGEAPKTVRVFHAPDETAHEVVDKLYDTVERSKRITTVAKKLTEINLPAAAAEGLVDFIYELAEKSKTNEQDNGRVASKVQNQPRAKLTTLRDELRRDIAKTKNQERDFTPDEINQMTEYFRRANKEIYQQKKINVSGAEADRLLRKIQFTENNPEQTQTDREM